MATKAKIINFLLAGYRHPDTDVPLAGGTITVTDAGTSNTAYVWDDRDKTLPTTTGRSTVTLDAYGKAEVYGDGIYKFVIKDSGGVTVETIDYFEVLSIDSGGLTVATKAILSAISTGTLADNTNAYMQGRTTSGDGGQGHFYWDSSDLSASVAADPQGGVFVAPDSDATGASGAWVRQYSGAINVLWFGANTTPGTTDMTATIQAAVDFGAGEVFLPKGVYLVSSTITLTSAINLVFQEGATLRPSTGSITLLKSNTTFTSELKVSNLKVSAFGLGLTGVVGLHIVNSGIGMNVVNPSFTEIDTGIIVENSYGLHIERPESYKTPNPIKVISPAGTISIDQPNLDNSASTSGGSGTGVGIYAEGPINVNGGYVQGFTYGVHATGDRPKIRNTYFEYNAEADMFFDGSTWALAESNYGFGFNGKAMIKARNANNGLFRKNLYTTSTATIGLYDVDTTNTDCFGDVEYVSATQNNKMGTVTGLLPAGVQSSSYKDGLHIRGTFSADTSTQVFKIATVDYSTVSCEITVQGIETTAHTASARKAFSFSIHRATAVTNSTPVELTDYAYDKSSSNYSITPSITLGTDGDGDTTVSVTFTQGGAIGFSTASGSVSLRAASTGSVLTVHRSL